MGPILRGEEVTLGALIIFLPFLIIWLGVCIVFAFFGTLVPSEERQIELSEVLNVTTVCKVLNNKNLISNKEYEFETQRVAGFYSGHTFQGYLFILAPVIYFLERSNFLDSMMLWLVKRWMKVHHFILDKSCAPPKFQILLTKICVFIAYSNGKILNLLGK